MDNIEIVFICGPYRSTTVIGIVENIQTAEKYAKKYWKLGYCVICPHKNTALFDGLMPDNVWLTSYKKLLSLSDVIVVLPGWEKSEGSIDEYKLAKELGKSIIFEA